MARWVLEPGHTAAGFRVRHMMVTDVRGAFKKVEGVLEFDPENPGKSSVDVTIQAGGIWSGDKDRDAHLAAADFLDVEKHKTITFRGNKADVVGENDFRVHGELTIRGITRDVTLNVRYLGQWDTPWWEDGKDKGPKKRAGFAATATISRQDFGVAWQSEIENGGVVVGDLVEITIDAEAILDS